MKPTTEVSITKPALPEQSSSLNRTSRSISIYIPLHPGPTLPCPSNMQATLTNALPAAPQQQEQPSPTFVSDAFGSGYLPADLVFGHLPGRKGWWHVWRPPPACGIETVQKPAGINLREVGLQTQGGRSYEKVNMSEKQEKDRDEEWQLNEGLASAMRLDWDIGLGLDGGSDSEFELWRRVVGMQTQGERYYENVNMSEKQEEDRDEEDQLNEGLTSAMRLDLGIGLRLDRSSDSEFELWEKVESDTRRGTAPSELSNSRHERWKQRLKGNCKLMIHKVMEPEVGLLGL